MNRMSASAATTVAVVLSLDASVTVAEFVDAGRSQVHFVATQSDAALEGSFSRFSADIDLDPAHPQTGTIKVAIDLTSVDAGGTDANNLLKGQDFFDVNRFPSATFESTSILSTGAGTYRASGPLTLKGHTSTLAIAFAVHPDANGLWFEGSAPLSRLAFKVGEGQWTDTSTLEDAVKIRFRIHVTR